MQILISKIYVHKIHIHDNQDPQYIASLKYVTQNFNPLKLSPIRMVIGFLFGNLVAILKTLFTNSFKMTKL